jgi:hypothetical protein
MRRLRAAGFCHGRRKNSHKEQETSWFAVGLGSRLASRGGFRHDRTVRQALNVNRDIDQLPSMGIGLTRLSAADQPSLCHQ